MKEDSRYDQEGKKFITPAEVRNMKEVTATGDVTVYEVCAKTIQLM